MREAGFTLVETLLALALGAMVVSAVLSTVKVSARVAARAAEASAAAEALGRAGSVLQGDADHALFADFLGAEAAMDLTELPRDGGAPSRVAYRLEQRPGQTILTRDGVVVFAGPSGLGFRYLDASGAWQTTWRPRTPPRAFALSDGTNLILATGLPALLPPDCALGPGPACPLDAGAFR